MPVLGGDITEVTWNHPTLGAGQFFPKANEGNTLDLGGFRNNDDDAQIDGAGELILQKNRKRGTIEIVCADDMRTREDSQKAVELAESEEVAEWTITHISGAVFKGTGAIVGDIQTDLNAATFTMKIAATKFKKIVG